MKLATPSLKPLFSHEHFRGPPLTISRSLYRLFDKGSDVQLDDSGEGFEGGAQLRGVSQEALEQLEEVLVSSAAP